MKKRGTTIYCIVFVSLLLLPFLFTNFKKNQISTLDNTYLPEIRWKEEETARERISEIENYLNMRIGFRRASLTLHQVLNYVLIQESVHPLYMLGKDGHAFLRNDNYINDYQHLNLDADWVAGFVEWMCKFRDTSEAHGANYYYLLIPDKKTLYSEFFPDGYNQFGDTSRTDLVLQALGQTDLKWIYAKDAMLAGKKDTSICNKRYDVGHCNENGTFIFCKLLIDRIRNDYPNVPALRREEFSVETVRKFFMPESYFPINETIPAYHSNYDGAVSDQEWLNGHLLFENNSSHTRYVDPEHPEFPKLLVLHDSYLEGKEKFFLGHFSEITFIHRNNLLGLRTLESYLEVLKPDIVVYENPERSFPTALYDPEQ